MDKEQLEAKIIELENNTLKSIELLTTALESHSQILNHFSKALIALTDLVVHVQKDIITNLEKNIPQGSKNGTQN